MCHRRSASIQGVSAPSRISSCAPDGDALASANILRSSKAASRSDNTAFSVTRKSSSWFSRTHHNNRGIRIMAQSHGQNICVTAKRRQRPLSGEKRKSQDHHATQHLLGLNPAALESVNSFVSSFTFIKGGSLGCSYLLL